MYNQYVELVESVLNEESDRESATVLLHTIENDGDIYNHQTTPIIKNLAKKISKGNFNKDLAVQAFMNVVKNAITKYNKGKHKVPRLTDADKKYIASSLLSRYEEEINDTAKEMGTK